MAIQGTVIRRPWVGVAACGFLVLVGAWLFKLSVLDVLAAAKRHEPVSLSFQGVLMSVVLTPLGLLALAAQASGSGGRLRARLDRMLAAPGSDRLRRSAYVILLVVLFGGAGAVYLWLRSELAAYGYDV